MLEQQYTHAQCINDSSVVNFMVQNPFKALTVLRKAFQDPESKEVSLIVYIASLSDKDSTPKRLFILCF